MPPMLYIISGTFLSSYFLCACCDVPVCAADKKESGHRRQQPFTFINFMHNILCIKVGLTEDVRRAAPFPQYFLYQDSFLSTTDHRPIQALPCAPCHLLKLPDVQSGELSVLLIDLSKHYSSII